MLFHYYYGLVLVIIFIFLLFYGWMGRLMLMDQVSLLSV